MFAHNKSCLMKAKFHEDDEAATGRRRIQTPSTVGDLTAFNTSYSYPSVLNTATHFSAKQSNTECSQGQ